MQYTSTQLFDEVIQLATPQCVTNRNMTLVRKLKDLQTYTERLEKIADDALAILKEKQS